MNTLTNTNEANKLDTLRPISIEVKGMTCSSCVERLEIAFEKLDSVQNVNVNFITEKVSLDFNPEIISSKELSEVIINSGFSIPNKSTNHSKNIERKTFTEEIKTLRLKVFVAATLTIPLFIISMAKMFPSLNNAMIGLYTQKQWVLIELILATPIVFILGQQFFKAGWVELKHLNPGMNSLIIIGVSAAYFYSLIALFSPGLFPIGTINSYFEASGIIITLILTGRYIEMLAKGRTRQAIKNLEKLQPKSARVIKEGIETKIPIETVVIDDLICVHPGECIAVDGILVEGSSFVDESMISGEAIPVEKSPGSIVTGGTINKSNTFLFRAQSVSSESILSHIIRMVETAQSSKIPIQKIADKIASIFVPIVICLAILTFAIWQFLGPTPTLNYAFITSVSVLLIACPCAIGLAAPTAIIVGTGRGAEVGVLFRKGEDLETLAKIDTVLLDKTGTITNGLPQLTHFITIEELKENDFLRLIAAAEALSEHPVAKAIVLSARKKSLDIPSAKLCNSKTGFGIDAQVEGHSIQVGSDRFMKKLNVNLNVFSNQAKELIEKGISPLYGVIDGRLAVLIAVTDTLKSDSKSALVDLKKIGLDTIMVTGDKELTAQSIANEIKIPIIHSEVSPKQKAEEVKRLQIIGRKVAFVGDGINDAPALAQADIGIAIGSGTNIAIETGDIVLTNGNLTSLVNAIRLSRQTMTTIRLNFFWAYAYNLALIPIAAGALFPFQGILLNPAFAAGAMSLSSIFVILNSLSLRRFQASKSS